MSKSRYHILKFLACLLLFIFTQTYASAQTPVSPVANPCPRYNAGSVVHNPPALFSQNGVLNVRFSYQTTTDSAGRTLFCFMTPDGSENPTLHVTPGDHLLVTVTNNTPAQPLTMAVNSPNCGATQMGNSSLNIHYHGTNISPTCHQDEVIKTIINSGETFQYNLAFPTNEPPGLYWYHPHVHGIAEAAVQGGASGAIVVEGIQTIQPAVAGLRQRVLMIRDQNTNGNLPPGGTNNVPSWDLALNNIPIPFPNYPPAVMHMLSGEKQLWRVSNSTADSILDLQVRFDGTPQNLQIVGLDAVPTGSQDGTRQGKIVNATHILIPTAGRAEFIVSAPPATVQVAQLVTLAINTGPGGDNDPQRPLANLVLVGSDNDASADGTVSSVIGTPWAQRFEGSMTATPTVKRALYFSEVLSDPSNPLSPTNFFITVDGATPVVFNANNPPAIITTQGAVEQWTVQNRTQENHEFHFHQLHFLLQSQNNFEINGSTPNTAENGQFLDMVQIPFWDGIKNHDFPSATFLLDFTGADIGDFVYHCHILGHEDNGMMAIIRVLPPPSSKVTDPKGKKPTSVASRAVDRVPAPTKTSAVTAMSARGGEGKLE